jgi:hypothetical protein
MVRREKFYATCALLYERILDLGQNGKFEKITIAFSELPVNITTIL